MSPGLVRSLFFCLLPLAALDSGGCFKGADSPLPNQAQATAPQRDEKSHDLRSFVLGLGYSDDVATELRHRIDGWGCDEWRKKLVRARQHYKTKRIDSAEVDKDERDVIVLLGHKIKDDFKIDRSPDIFDLENAVAKQRTNCLGYVQLLHVLGSSLGLSVNAILVTEPVDGGVIYNTHVASLVNLSSGKKVMVDLVPDGFISDPFDLEHEFGRNDYTWTLKGDTNPLKLHRGFRIWDDNRLVASIPYSRAIVCCRLGRYAEGIPYFTEAIRIDGTDPNNYIYRGLAFLILQDHDESLSDLTKAIGLDKNNAAAYYWRGYLLKSMKRYREAVADFTKAIELDPKNSRAYDKRGKARRSLGQDVEAEKDFAEAKRLREGSESSTQGEIEGHEPIKID
jgi:hypothetical protein